MACREQVGLGLASALAVAAATAAGCPGAEVRRSPPEAPAPPAARPPQDAAAPEAAPPDAGYGPDRRMAVTVDDLPAAFFDDYRDAAHRLEVVRAWAELVRSRSLPVTGFVIGENVRRQPELMRVWTEAGVSLGSHTWSHPRLRRVGLERYLEDFARGHDAVARLLPAGSAIPFRYPYLYEGFDPAERDRIRARLAELGSPAAPVTVATSDWLYAREQGEALRRGDLATAERCRRAWRSDIEDSTLVAEWRARELFGREPPQVLLLHANELNARHLGEVLDWLEGRGYRFVGLSDALEDPAYHEPDASLALTGDGHWVRLGRSRRLGGG